MGNLAELSRNELLQSSGNFTLSELSKFGKGPEIMDKDGSLGQDMLYVSLGVKLRQIPANLLNLVKTNWEQTQDINQVIEPLGTSFYVYRECVARLGGLITPFVKKDDGVWEWPDPTDFSWGDEQTKTLAMLMGAYKREQEPTVSVLEGNIEHKLSLLSGVVSSKTLPDLLAKPYEHIKFEIPALSEVRMLNQFAWQNYTLRTWGHYLLTTFDQLINHKLDASKTEKGMLLLINDLQQKVFDFPGVRYTNTGEKPRPQYLFTFNF